MKPSNRFYVGGPPGQPEEARFECPECQHEFEELEPQCPECGYKFAEPDDGS